MLGSSNAYNLIPKTTFTFQALAPAAFVPISSSANAPSVVDFPQRFLDASSNRPKLRALGVAISEIPRKRLYIAIKDDPTASPFSVHSRPAASSSDDVGG